MGTGQLRWEGRFESFSCKYNDKLENGSAQLTRKISTKFSSNDNLVKICNCMKRNTDRMLVFLAQYDKHLKMHLLAVFE